MFISNAEKNAKISIKKISIVLEQPEFLCTNFSKERKINGSKIQKDDIEFLIKESKKQLTQNDNRQSLFNSIPKLILKSKNNFENKIANQIDLFDSNIFRLSL